MLQIGFILLTIGVVLLLYAGLFVTSGRAFAEPAKRRAFRLRAALFFTAWVAYIGGLSVNGAFLAPTMPPRIPLLLVFPAFAFTAFFFASGKFKGIIEQVPARWPVYFQSFRILVELLLLRAFMENLIPREATFEGYNFDIVIGLAAPFIAAIGFRGGQPKKPLLILYNMAGFATLTVVVFVFISQAYFPGLWGKPATSAPIAIGMFPYTFLPGLLMPVAVFMHVLSLVKTKAA